MLIIELHCADEHLRTGHDVFEQWCGCMQWRCCARLGFDFVTETAWWSPTTVVSLQSV